MSSIKQSIVFGCFTRGGVSPEAAIRAAAKAGYRSVEMVPQEHWGLVRDCGMDIAVIVGHKSLTDGLNKRENHDRIEQELLSNIDLAAANGIPGLICLSGNREGKSEEEGLTNTIDCLKRVTKAAEAKGVTLNLELLNSKVDHPDYQCDSTPWGVAVCTAINSPRVKLLYDIYHMQIMEGDLIRTIRDNIQHIGHFHTAGNPGRKDMDDTQEIYYPAVMRAIAATGYDGYVGHEYVPKADAIASMEATFAICNV